LNRLPDGRKPNRGVDSADRTDAAQMVCPMYIGNVKYKNKAEECIDCIQQRIPHKNTFHSIFYHISSEKSSVLSKLICVLANS